MSYIYVLKQKENCWRKVGLSTSPTERISTLEKTWGKFDRDSIVYKFDIDKYGENIKHIEKLIHSLLYSKGLKISMINKDKGLDGHTEFFKLFGLDIEHIIEETLENFIIKKISYTQIIKDTPNKLEKLDSSKERELIQEKNKDLIRNTFSVETEKDIYSFIDYDKFLENIQEDKTIKFYLPKFEKEESIKLLFDVTGKSKNEIEELTYLLFRLDFYIYSKNFIKIGKGHTVGGCTHRTINNKYVFVLSFNNHKLNDFYYNHLIVDFSKKFTQVFDTEYFDITKLRNN